MVLPKGPDSCYEENNKSKRRRIDGGGRKAMDEDMEEALLSWIQDLRSQNLRVHVSRKMIRAQAKEAMTTADFKAIRGWFECFMKWKGLSLHRKTTVCQKTPADCFPKLVSLLLMYEASRSNTSTDTMLSSPWMR